MVIKLFQKHLQIKPYLVCLNWPSEDETKSLQTDGTSNSYFKVFSLAEVKDRGMQSAYSVFWSSVRRNILFLDIVPMCLCTPPPPPPSPMGR